MEMGSAIQTFKNRNGVEFKGYVIKRAKFCGFIAHYGDGTTIKEIDIRSVDHGSISTNWYKIDKSQLVCLELINDSTAVAVYSKKDHPDIKPEDWYFTCQGAFSPQDGHVENVGRRIGVKNNGTLAFTEVDTRTGQVRSGIKKL